MLWILASVAFGFYVANFGSYNKTYGSLAGIIVFLLWLWITNLALLFGAEVDAELERSRQLLGGIEAEEELQLPPRDTSKLDKKQEKEKASIAKGRALRLSEGETTDPDEVQDDNDASNEDRNDREGRSQAREHPGSRRDDQQVRSVQTEQTRWSDRKQGLPGLVGRVRGKNRS